MSMTRDYIMNALDQIESMARYEIAHNQEPSYLTMALGNVLQTRFYSLMNDDDAYAFHHDRAIRFSNCALEVSPSCPLP